MILQQMEPQELRPEDRVKLQAGIDDCQAMYPTDPPDHVRLVQMQHLLKTANKLEVGEYVELGVHRGLTLRFIHRCMDSARMLYGFDTFTGFDKRDIEAERKINKHHWSEGGFLPTSAGEVGKFVGGGKHPANLELVVGWFPETFGLPAFTNMRWQFAHIDMDLYQPTKAALDLLWPRMVPGGVVMVHDYGCGSFQTRRAVDEFCFKVKQLPIEMPDWHVTAVIRKPL